MNAALQDHHTAFELRRRRISASDSYVPMIPLPKTVRAAKFLITGPVVLLVLVAINWFTSPHHWWVQWAALGIGIAWAACLIRVLRALVILGGLAALIAFLRRGDNPGPSH